MNSRLITQALLAALLLFSAPAFAEKERPAREPKERKPKVIKLELPKPPKPVAVVKPAPAPKPKKAAWFTSPAHQVRFYLPGSLVERADFVGFWVDERSDQFLAQCSKKDAHGVPWRDPKLCESTLKKARLRVVDDYVIPCSAFWTHLCAGLDGSIVMLYNKINDYTGQHCKGAPLVRTAQQMYELSGETDWWIRRGGPILYCGNVADILPAVVHEICHAFGRKVGHVAGYEECEPIRKR